MEIIFCVFFLAELLVRMMDERAAFFLSPSQVRWNVFDAILCVMAVYSLLTDDVMGDNDDGDDNFTFLRVLRLIKTARILRVLRTLRICSQLRRSLDGILGCLSALFWLFVLLVVILFMFTLAFMQGTATFLRTTPEADPQLRSLLLNWFGSIPQGCLHLFSNMIGGESWILMCESLGHISPM